LPRSVDITSGLARLTPRREPEIRGLAIAPLRVQDRVVGLLGVWMRTPRAFDTEELELLQGMADVAAIAVDNARLTLEVGVFTGYSSLAVALALPADGTIVACDVNEEFTAVARRYWKEAGVDNMIDLLKRNRSRP
jgi:predicted O-methyltransferase YrrM